MSPEGHHHDEDLARRVYSYFIFRLRQPEDAERLTRLSFERFWREQRLSQDAGAHPEMPVFTGARRAIAENPRPRGATRVSSGQRTSAGLSNELALAIGRLHGRERDAIALRFGGELSVGEIAELLGLTPADVKQRLARGIRSLRDLGVKPMTGEEESTAERAGARRPKKGEPEQGKPHE